MEEACRRGDLDTVIALVHKKPNLVTHADNIGITPLHRAAAGNHLKLVRFLLSRGASVNAVDKYLDSPLKKAAYGGHVDVVNELVLNGADINHADQSGKLPLHHSAEQGQLQSVEILLDARSYRNFILRASLAWGSGVTPAAADPMWIIGAWKI